MGETSAISRATGEPQEEWRSCPGFPDRYSVSSNGRVWSWIAKPRRLLTWQYDEDGYPLVGLWNGQRQTNHKVHRLVALAFMPDKQNVLHDEVAHLDGNRANPRLSNLKWVSRVENISHKREHGTLLFGERHSRALLTEAQVVEMLSLLGKRGWSYARLAQKYGVTRRAIESIRFGKNWRHIPRPPELRKNIGTGIRQDGEMNHWAKLTSSQATEIRRRYNQGERAMSLAAEFCISKATIYKLLAGETYRNAA